MLFHTTICFYVLPICIAPRLDQDRCNYLVVVLVTYHDDRKILSYVVIDDLRGEKFTFIPTDFYNSRFKLSKISSALYELWCVATP